MKKSTIILAIILVVIIGAGIGFYFYNENQKKNVENEIYGVVTQYKNENMEIISEGKKYNFDISLASKPKTEIVEDDTVKVKYKGELKDSNNEATVVKIISEVSSTTDTTASTVSTNETTANAENSTASTTTTTTNTTSSNTTTKKEDDENAEHYITGTVTDITMNSVTIKANFDGNTYTFATESAKKDSGIQNGDSVKIVHEGKVVNQTEKQTIKATYVKKLTTNSTTSNNTSSKTIKGTIVDASMNAIIVEANGKTYSFSTMKATKNGDFKVGKTITVTYTGNLSESTSITATSVTTE